MKLYTRGLTFVDEIPLRDAIPLHPVEFECPSNYPFLDRNGRFLDPIKSERDYIMYMILVLILEGALRTFWYLYLASL